jgi:hypothetical protein
VNAAFPLRPRQALDREPTAWENELGDALEAAFGSGVYELHALVARLNASGVRSRDGERWTAEGFAQALHELGLP